MKTIIYKLTSLIIVLFLGGLSGCEKSEEWDGQYCAKCQDEWDEDVNWVYNVMPTKLCDYDLTELQKTVDQFESDGYTCGEIKKQY